MSLKVKKNKYGRGVYTDKSIKEGELILCDHLMLLKPDDRKGPTVCRYDFQVDSEDTPSAIALGITSLLNHSDTPNCDFETFFKKGLPFVKVWAIKDIRKGQELKINYGYDPTEAEEYEERSTH
jgi:SET domain-containing protein